MSAGDRDQPPSRYEKRTTAASRYDERYEGRPRGAGRPLG